MNKIESIEQFLKCCKKIRKEKKSFVLSEYYAKSKPDKATSVASRYSIYWQSPSTSLWNPVAAVYHRFYRPASGAMLHADVCWDIIGLSLKQYSLLEAAVHERNGHSVELRTALLKATGLKEIPIKKRRKSRDDRHKTSNSKAVKKSRRAR